MHRLSYVLFLSILPTLLWAQSIRPKGIQITPIVGLERVQKFEPTPQMKNRFFYGARVLYPLIVANAEAEYTHAYDTSYSSSTSTTYKDEEDKLKVGLRGTAAGAFASLSIRGGAQVRKNLHTVTTSISSSTKKTTTKVNPYAGVGASLFFGSYISLSGEITGVYVPTSDSALDDIEYQPSLGLTLHF